MSNELRTLALAVVLGFVHILLATHFATRRNGIWWNVGPRDQAMPPLEGVAGRLDRASRNFLETFPLFAAALLAAHLSGRNGVLTLWGTQLYFWGRVVYLPLYVLGVPVVRSVVWSVAAVGIFLILLALL